MIIRNEFNVEVYGEEIVIDYFPEHMIRKIYGGDKIEEVLAESHSATLSYVIDDKDVNIVADKNDNILINSIIDDYHKFTEGSHKEGVIRIPKSEIDSFICCNIMDEDRDTFGVSELFISEVLLSIIDKIYPDLESFEDTIFANSSKYDNMVDIDMEDLVDDFRHSTNPISYMGVRPKSKKKENSILVNFLRLLNKVSKNGFEVYSNMLLLIPSNEPLVIHFTKGSYDVFEIMEECSIDNTCIYRGDFIKIMDRIIMMHVDKKNPVDISTHLDLYSETFSGYLEWMREFPEEASYDVLRPTILNSIAMLDVDDKHGMTDSYLLK